eukprot:gene25439-30718_t
MIVLRQVSPPKSAPSPTKPKKTGAVKAKEVLKKAVVDGKLGELLWQDEKGVGSKPTTSHGNNKVGEIKPEEMDMREFYALNDIAIWNEVLEARVLRTSKLADLFEKFFPSSTANLGTVSLDPENEDVDGQAEEEEVESEDEKEENNTASENASSTAQTPRKGSSIRMPRNKADQLIGIVNLVKKGKKLKPSPKSSVPPKELTLEEQLKAFETMPVSMEKGKKMSLIGKTAMRVKDFIANTRRATLNHLEVDAERSAEEANDSENPEVDSSEDSDGDDKFSSDAKQTIPASVDMKWGGTLPDTSSSHQPHSAARHSQVQIQQINKLRKHSRAQKKSIDVVAGLFQMSNELREERESIMFRVHQKEGDQRENGEAPNSDAFLNRETTLKYNDQLDEVAMTKQEAILTQKRAAVLRLKKNALKYKFYHADHVGRFMSFWTSLLVENDNRDNGRYYKDAVHALTGEEVDDEEEEEKDQFVIKDNASKLESLFEENLGLLFQTKTKISREASSKRQLIKASAGSRESSRPTSPESTTRSDFLKKGDGSTRANSRRLISGSNLATFTDSDEEHENSDKFSEGLSNMPRKITSAKSVTWSDAGDDASSVSKQSLKKHSLAAIIERLQKMGLYSESKLKYTYGLNRKEIQEQKAEAERKRKEDDDRRRLKRGESGRFGMGGDGGVLHVKTLGDGLEIPAGMLEGMNEELSGMGSRMGSSANFMHSRMNSSANFLRNENRGSLSSAGGGMKVTSVDLALNTQLPSRPPTQPAVPFPSQFQSQPQAIIVPKEGANSVYEQTSQILHQKILNLSFEMGKAAVTAKVNPDLLTAFPAMNSLEQSTVSVDGEGTFITQVSQIDVGDGGGGGLIHRLSCTSAVVNTLDPDYLFEGMGESMGGNSSLVGKWGYDPSVHTLPPRIVPRPSSPSYAPQSHSVPSPSHLLPPLGTTEEVIFDPTYPPSVLIVKFRGEQPISCHEVSLQSIFTTESIFPESITVRTYDTFNYPLGYLGTYPREMWGEIEENIYSCLLGSVDKTHFPPDLPLYTIPPQYVIPHVGGENVGVSIPYYAIRPPRNGKRKRGGAKNSMGNSGKKARGVLSVFEKLLPSPEDIQKSIEKYNIQIRSHANSHPDTAKVNPPMKKKHKKKVTLALQHNQEFLIEEAGSTGSWVTEGTYQAKGYVAIGGEGSVDFAIGGKVLVTPQKKKDERDQEATVFSRASAIPTPSATFLEKVRAVKVPRQRPPLTPPRSHPSPRTTKSIRALPPSLTIQPPSSTSYISPLSPLKVTTPMLSTVPPTMRQAEKGTDGSSKVSTNGWDAVSETTTDLDDGFFTYDLHIVLIIESRRIMQLYFTKKLLQLDLAVNVHLTCYDAQEALAQNPLLYGLMFISYADLIESGTRALRKVAKDEEQKTKEKCETNIAEEAMPRATEALRYALNTLIPAPLSRASYTLYVYDLFVPENSQEEFEIYEVLEEGGVEDVFHPPYTLEAIKTALNVHKRKQDMKVLLKPPSPPSYLSRSESGMSFSSYESMSI